MRRFATLALLLPMLQVRAQQPEPKTAAHPAEFSFVVLGHLRGDRHGPNPKIAELLTRVRELKPAFAVLTGDMIWGDTDHNPSDSLEILREWTYLDSALATLAIPIYRVPGNHDINDIVTRDIYFRRYGAHPREVAVGNSRLLLLASPYIPPDGDTAKMKVIRARALDSAQVTWLRSTLANTAFQHTFVFMHDLLWWSEDASPWWQQVHPLLAAGKVDAVYSGDYGPMKFSTMSRDGVQYYQSAIEDSVSLAMLRVRLGSRLLSSQFDNFLETRVSGAHVDVRVHTIAEVSSGVFTPQHWANVDAPLPPDPLVTRVWNLVGKPKRLIALAAVALILMSVGWVARGLTSTRQ